MSFIIHLTRLAAGRQITMSGDTVGWVPTPPPRPGTGITTTGNYPRCKHETTNTHNGSSVQAGPEIVFYLEGRNIDHINSDDERRTVKHSSNKATKIS